MRATALPC
ncbi:UNVERIFIED_CONTAM: hypothetical protein GTU68_002748 [Idotea baltica]|nr:hypothetical protein [Idotea baltica]